MEPTIQRFELTPFTFVAIGPFYYGLPWYRKCDFSQLVLAPFLLDSSWDREINHISFEGETPPS